MGTIVRHYREVRQALRKGNLPNGFTLGRYGFSPYAACEHGCRYCDGRAEKYFVEGAFDKDIVIRKNLPELLHKEVAALREPGIIAIGSGISDPYQPVESDERIMEQCARIIAGSNCAVSLLTKSSLILRDIGLWKEVHEKNGFILMLSLTFCDDAVRHIFEPGASSVEERLTVIERFKKEGMIVGVLAMPLIPCISDTPDNIERLFTALKEKGVDFIVPGGLTLRPGRQKDGFMDVIGTHFPHLRHDFDKLYRENRPSGACTYEYRSTLARRLDGPLRQCGVPAEIPHYAYKNRMALYDELFILLEHMRGLYQRKNTDLKPLNAGIEKYAAWLTKEKQSFNRKRKSDYRELEDRLRRMASTGELGRIIGNGKLGDFMKQVVLDRKTFNYCTLRLVLC